MRVQRLGDTTGTRLGAGGPGVFEDVRFSFYPSFGHIIK